METGSGACPETARWIMLALVTQSTVLSMAGLDVAAYALDASASHQYFLENSHASALTRQVLTSQFPGGPVGTATSRTCGGRSPDWQPSASWMAEIIASVVAASLPFVGCVSVETTSRSLMPSVDEKKPRASSPLCSLTFSTRVQSF